jgi:hypothetical protein
MATRRKGVPEDYVITHVTGPRYLVAKFINDEPQSKYLVELTGVGYVCECPAFGYSDKRADFRECKHGKMLLQAIKDGTILDFRNDVAIDEDEEAVNEDEKDGDFNDD